MKKLLLLLTCLTLSNNVLALICVYEEPDHVELLKEYPHIAIITSDPMNANVEIERVGYLEAIKLFFFNDDALINSNTGWRSIKRVNSKLKVNKTLKGNSADWYDSRTFSLPLWPPSDNRELSYYFEDNFDFLDLIARTFYPKQYSPIKLFESNRKYTYITAGYQSESDGRVYASNRDYGLCSSPLPVWSVKYLPDIEFTLKCIADNQTTGTCSKDALNERFQ